MLRWLRDHGIELLIYGLMLLAAGLLLEAQRNLAAAADLPYERGFTPNGKLNSTFNNVPSSLSAKDNDYLPRYPVRRSPGIPIPQRRPDTSEEFDPTPPEPNATERRFALLRCGAFYALAATVMKRVKDLEGYEDAAMLRRRAVAAVRASQAPGIKGPRWVEDSNDVLVDVYEDYVTSPITGQNIYDRYHEVCKALVDPLLKEGS